MNFLSALNLGALWGAFGALSLISLIWLGGPHIQIASHKPLEALWVRILLSVIIVCTVIAVNIYKWYQKQKLNKKVIEELKASELTSSDTSQPSPNKLNEQFNSIDLILQKHDSTKNKNIIQKLFLDKKEYIYQKPWFLILGAPGVGKTTSILNSGLNFPVGTIENADKLSGTKDCDWFLTDEALFLDTAGRFVEQDNQSKNSQDWKELLSLLKRCRTKQPINGLVLVVGVDDILKNNDDHLQNQINEFRVRLQELQTTFNTTFPLYLLINKIDLIPGFDQYFNYLSEEDRKKVLGIQLDTLSENTAEQINKVLKRLDEISNAIELNIFNSVAYNNQQNESSDLALSFASEFDNFITTLKTYLKKLFNLSKYDSTLYLGGVYFSSSTQQSITDNAPIQSRYQLRNKYSTNHLSGILPKSKVYFLHHFYQYTLIETSNLAGIDIRWIKKQQRLYWGSCIALLLLSGIAAFTISQMYAKNKAYLGLVQENYKNAQDMASQANPDDALELLKLADTVKSIPSHNIPENLSNIGLLNDLGFSQHKLIANASQLKYQELAGINLTNLIEDSIQKKLKEGIDTNSETELYQHLKAYLMLHQHQHYDNKFIAQWTKENLVSDIFGTYSENSLSELNAILLTQKITPIQSYDTELVQSARELFVNHDIANTLYTELLEHSKTLDDKSLPSVSFISMGGTATQNLFRRISGKTLNAPMLPLYTKDGYQKIFLPYITTHLDRFYQKEKWVVGDEVFAISKDEVLSDIYQKYTDDYINYWKQYIADVKMIEPKDLQQTIVMSKQLSEKKSALAGIIRGIAHHTNLQATNTTPNANTEPNKEAQQAADKKTAALQDSINPNNPQEEALTHNAPQMDGYLQDVASNFSQFQVLVQSSEGSTPQLDEITKSINDLYVYLVALQMSMQNNDTLMPDNKPVVNYQAQVSRLPEPFKPMLDRFVGQISQTSKEYRQTQEESKKQQEADEEKKIVLAIAEQQDNNIKENCQASIANKYPISKTANKEVSLKELEQMFGSKGLYMQTLNSNIMANNKLTTPFRSLLDEIDRRPIYENAQSINSRYFAGADKPFLDFTLKPVLMTKEIKELIINYDGKKMVYYHGPQKSTKLTWPASTNTLSFKIITFDNKTRTLETKGDWSIFKMIDQSTQVINTKDGDGIIATFGFNEHEVHLELKSISGPNPFLLTGLRGFVC